MVRVMMKKFAKRPAAIFGLAAKVRQRARGFLRAEEGTMVFFVLVCLLLMLFSGGMAIDMMRYESERSRIQAVADSAALAAASIRRSTGAEEIVEDWFAKAGVLDALVDVRADDRGLNFRDVYVETRTTTRPYFMQMMGITELASSGEGRAIETRSNVEISMVLDVSGSMNDHGRAGNLKIAAKEFITELLASDIDNRTSFNIVPYNGQVMLSDAMWSRHTKSYSHALPNATTARQCIDFPQSAYASAPIPLAGGHVQSSYADTFQWAYDEGRNATPPSSFTTNMMAIDTDVVWCTGAKANAIRLGSNRAATLTSMIDNLVFTGATSIDLGFKWGASLLDPASSTLFSGVAESAFTNRPLPYEDPYSLKVVVLMTDGEHFAQEMVNSGYRGTDLSPIYRYRNSSNQTRYAIHHASKTGTEKYYFPDPNKWYSTAGALGSATQLSWNTVWSELRMRWAAWQLYARPFATSNADRLTRMNAQMDLFRTKVPTGTMDSRLLTLCRQARDKNVVIFGIAFEAPAGGANVIRSCASAGRFYDVAGLDIRTAFRSIRMQIQALRLTQ